MQKLGEGAKPFTLSFPPSAPNSVLIRGEDGDSAEMGVSYAVKLHMGDESDDYCGFKKSSVNMNIRKVTKWLPAIFSINVICYLCHFLHFLHYLVKVL